MIVIIDGEEVKVQNDVKIIWEEDDDTELHLTATYEGIITDLVENGEVIDSAWLEHHEILDTIHESGKYKKLLSAATEVFENHCDEMVVDGVMCDCFVALKEMIDSD